MHKDIWNIGGNTQIPCYSEEQTLMKLEFWG